MNDIAEKLKLSNSAITMHVKKLEECGIITTISASGKHGNQKICSLLEDRVLVDIIREGEVGLSYDVEINIGLYSNYQVYPTCGLATKDVLIGEMDEARYFADPMRMNAAIIWFSRGFIEYRIPNYLKSGQIPTEIQIAAELSSEAPGSSDDWPSDIHFSLNGYELGFWTSPGDFGSSKGRFTPSWWFPASTAMAC